MNPFIDLCNKKYKFLTWKGIDTRYNLNFCNKEWSTVDILNMWINIKIISFSLFVFKDNYRFDAKINAISFKVYNTYERNTYE